MQISTEQKTAGLIIVGIAVFMTANFLVEGVFREAPDPNLTCEITAPNSQNGPPLSVVPSPIRKIAISGFLDDPFEENLFDFEGTAVVRSDDKTVNRLARGVVFLDQNKRIEALTITLEAELYSRETLSLATLNDSGRLDSSKDTVFAFEKKEFKMLHPMTYRCTVDRKRLGLDASDQRQQDLFDKYLPWFTGTR